jgi:hypothetical protein
VLEFVVIVRGRSLARPLIAYDKRFVQLPALDRLQAFKFILTV